MNEKENIRLNQYKFKIRHSMTSSDKFCLEWNDFQKNVSSSFKEIREDFCDVTLVGEGGSKMGLTM